MFDNVVRFKIFDKFPEIDCRFYGKEIDGGAEERKMISMKQVHGNHIVYVDNKFNGEIAEDADGLITGRKNIFLRVKAADCAPVFFYEPNIKIIGVVHAGWKGTLKEITGKMISHIVRHGGRAENIIIAIGPYIHDCCYNIPSERFLRFKTSFPDFSFKKPNFLDLGKICAFQMIKLGVPERQIEISKICTECQHDKFYSFRMGDVGVKNIGVIGMR